MCRAVFFPVDSLFFSTAQGQDAESLELLGGVDIRIIISIVTLIVAVIIARLIHYLIREKFMKYAQTTDDQLDNMLAKAVDGPVVVLVYLVAFYIVIAVLDPADYKVILNKAIYSLIAVDVCWLMFRLVDAITGYLTLRYKDKNKTLAGSLFPMIRNTAKFFLAFITFILIVQDLGYSVSSLLAGLGIGGLAVALAAKDTLANIFGSITIFLDKPFLVGDWIISGGTEGVVEDISFRCTRIRTFDRTLVSIPNSVIANQTIENVSRRPQRRISTTIGVTYSCGYRKLKMAVDRIRQIILDHPHTQKEGVFVYFSQFDQSSLGIFLYFFVDTANWDLFMQYRQELFLSFMEAFEELGVSFAFPSRSVYLENMNKTPAVPGSDQ